jgi:hypothetical protein
MKMYLIDFIKYIHKYILNIFLPEFGFFDNKSINSSLSFVLNQRILEAVSDPSNLYIPRVLSAGNVKRGIQTMHNGIKVLNSGYYGYFSTQLLIKNQGVHEPQEEYIFQEFLKIIPDNSTMIELGSYWGFYSMWFSKSIKGSKNYLVEPDMINMLVGKKNFSLNKISADFTNAYINNSSYNSCKIPTYSIDDFLKIKNIEYVTLIHSDIQGYEFNMLKGAADTLYNKKIGYFFISTHGSDVHSRCIELLISYNYVIVISILDFESFSYDGLIVARSPNCLDIKFKEIIKNNTQSYNKYFEIVSE